MNVGGDYKLIMHNGGSSMSIEGELLAILKNKSLRYFGFNGTVLQTQRFPLLPNGTDFSVDDGEWYIVKELGTDRVEAIYSGWIKSNGILEADLGTIVIEATFNSKRSKSIITSAIISGGILDFALSDLTGTESVDSSELVLSTKYSIEVADVEGTVLHGTYLGTLSYTLLRSMGINGLMEYGGYSWAVNNTTNLPDYSWYLFENNTGTNFAIPKELLLSEPSTLVAQDKYKLQVTGIEDDVPTLRSVLLTLGCTDVVIGKTS